MNPAQFKGAMGDAIAKTTPHLYRDCLRLVSHVGGQSAKGRAMKMMVTSEFRKHADVTDEKELEALRANAVRALSNYMVYESSRSAATLNPELLTSATTPPRCERRPPPTLLPPRLPPPTLPLLPPPPTPTPTLRRQTTPPMTVTTASFVAKRPTSPSQFGGPAGTICSKDPRLKAKINRENAGDGQTTKGAGV